MLRRRLETSPEFAEDVQTLDDAQRAVLSTIGGMARLLESERLQKVLTPEQWQRWQQLKNEMDRRGRRGRGGRGGGGGPRTTDAH